MQSSYCNYMPIPALTFMMSSTWLKVVLTVWQYLRVCWSHDCQRMTSERNVKLALGVVYTLSPILPITWTLLYNCRSVTYTCQATPGVILLQDRDVLDMDEIMDYVHYGIGVVIPSMFLIFSQLALAGRLRQMSREQQIRGNRRKTQHRLTVTILVLVIIYCLCVPPVDTMYILLKFGHLASPGLSLAQNVLRAVRLINYACNFAIYGLLNTDFRCGLIQLCSCGRTLVPTIEDEEEEERRDQSQVCQ